MRNFLKRRWWMIAVLVLLIGTGYWYATRSKPETYTTVTPTRQTVVDTLEISGAIDATEKIDIPYGTGKLSWVGVTTDQPVKKWQALATMDTRTLQKQQQQQVNLHGQTFREREQTLDNMDYYDDATLTDEERRIAESADLSIKNSALAVEISDITIKQATITTPIEGIITRLDQPYGGVIAGPTDMIQVVNPKTLYFAAVVDEVDISSLKLAQTASIQFDAYPSDQVPTKIQTIEFAPSVSKNGGTGYKVHFPLPLDNSTLKYRLGMNGSVTVTLAEKPDTLTVPTDSLIMRDGKTYVEVLDGTSNVMREVNVGLETDQVAEILSGLSEQDQVILPDSAENK